MAALAIKFDNYAWNNAFCGTIERGTARGCMGGIQCDVKFT